MAIDQEKAFDRKDHSYIKEIIKTLGFGPQCQRWTHILYQEIKSQVMVNGELTNEISITRSVRRGCPISMLLFVIAAEGLLELIRQNPKW